jgi:hypothetical protein
VRSASLLFLIGCSSSSTPPVPTTAAGSAATGAGSASAGDCARYLERSRGPLQQLAKDMGKPLAPGFDKQFLDTCQASDKAGHRDPSMTCVLAAADDAAVGACWTAAMKKYKDRGRQLEATLQLDKLGRAAKAAFDKTGAYPIGEAPLTPTTPCCAQDFDKAKRCAMVDADWAAPIWKTLGYAVGMPFQFQYSYKGDGKHFIATAVADLDCDGHPVKYTLTGLVNAGKPTLTLVEPD